MIRAYFSFGIGWKRTFLAFAIGFAISLILFTCSHAAEQPDFGQYFIQTFDEAFGPLGPVFEKGLRIQIAVTIFLIIALTIIIRKGLKEKQPSYFYDGQNWDNVGQEWRDRGITLEKLTKERVISGGKFFHVFFFIFLSLFSASNCFSIERSYRETCNRCPELDSGIYEKGYLVFDSKARSINMMKDGDGSFVMYASPHPDNCDALISDRKRIPLWFALMLENGQSCYCIKSRE